jgi:hypothetical protein
VPSSQAAPRPTPATTTPTQTAGTSPSSTSSFSSQPAEPASAPSSWLAAALIQHAVQAAAGFGAQAAVQQAQAVVQRAQAAIGQAQRQMTGAMGAAQTLLDSLLHRWR